MYVPLLCIDLNNGTDLDYQHIEYAAVHRDDSDDEDIDDLELEEEEGWEDKLAQLRYPDEVGGPSIIPDGEEPSDDDEWEDFDEYDFEDEEDLWESDVVSDSFV